MTVIVIIAFSQRLTKGLRSYTEAPLNFGEVGQGPKIAL